MEWISVEDRLPEMMDELPYSDDVLAFCVSHGQPTEFGAPNTYRKGEKYVGIDRLVKWRDTGKISFRADRYYGKVTHWMPLPEWPKKEGENI